MILMRNDLINKVIDSNAADLDGAQATVTFIDFEDLENTLEYEAILSVNGQTLTATFKTGRTVDLISPEYNNYSKHDLYTVTI